MCGDHVLTVEDKPACFLATARRIAAAHGSVNAQRSSFGARQRHLPFPLRHSRVLFISCALAPRYSFGRNGRRIGDRRACRCFPPICGGGTAALCETSPRSEREQFHFRDRCVQCLTGDKQIAHAVAIFGVTSARSGASAGRRHSLHCLRSGTSCESVSSRCAAQSKTVERR